MMGTVMIGCAMCNHCDFQTFGNCFGLVQATGVVVVDMNDLCPKGRKIYKGDITFEEVK